MNKEDKVIELALELRRRKQIEENRKIQFEVVNLVLDEYRLRKLEEVSVEKDITVQVFIKELIDIYFLDHQTKYITEILLNKTDLTMQDIYEILYK